MCGRHRFFFRLAIVNADLSFSIYSMQFDKAKSFFTEINQQGLRLPRCFLLQTVLWLEAGWQKVCLQRY
jgi:hypothetical protein